MYVIGLARLALHTPCRHQADKYVDVRPRTSRPERLLPEECRDYKGPPREGASACSIPPHPMSVRLRPQTGEQA